MQGVELVGVANLLCEDFRHPLAGDGEGRLQRIIAGDLAADVAVEPAQPGPQAAHPAHGLLVAPAMDQAGYIAPRLTADAQERLTQLDAVPLRQPVEPFDTAH